MSWQIRGAEADDGLGVGSLFKRLDVPCFCQYYQYEGDHRDWQNRCANERADNLAELVRDLKERRLHAVVATVGEAVIGWARVSRATTLGKLYENRLYRSLAVLNEGDRQHTFAVTCFLVDPEWRRRGVARDLLSHCVTLAQRLGASCLEAFPRGATDVSDAEQWTGPVALYERSGFVRVHDFAPYPVYRLQLK